MAWLAASEAVALVLVVIIVVPIVWLLVRRSWLGRRGGTFDCCLRVSQARPGDGWVLGFGRYDGNTLKWFRAVSPAVRPRVVFNRSTAVVGAQRDLEPEETAVIGEGMHVVELVSPEQSSELAMQTDALTGLLAWIEAAPPGEKALPYA